MDGYTAVGMVEGWISCTAHELRIAWEYLIRIGVVLDIATDAMDVTLPDGVLLTRPTEAEMQRAAADLGITLAPESRNRFVVDQDPVRHSDLADSVLGAAEAEAVMPGLIGPLFGA